MKRASGSTRRHARRQRLREAKHLRRYGYIQEWKLELWRFRMRKQGLM